MVTWHREGTLWATYHSYIEKGKLLMSNNSEKFLIIEPVLASLLMLFAYILLGHQGQADSSTILNILQPQDCRWEVLNERGRKKTPEMKDLAIPATLAAGSQTVTADRGNHFFPNHQDICTVGFADLLGTGLLFLPFLLMNRRLILQNTAPCCYPKDLKSPRL